MMVGMSHLLRVELPDVPGSLGAVATAIGDVGGNIEAIEIVEHRQDGTAVDDVFVELTPELMPDVVVSAVQRLDGVRVMWVSRYAAGGNLHLDLEAVEVITEEPTAAVATLTELVPKTFRCDWALAIGCEGDKAVPLAATPAAPGLPEALAQWFPLLRPGRPEVGVWAGWSATAVAVAPLGGPERMIVFGRHGGPDILDSELARLGHLASLAASIESAATA
jgi:hypothetical protein